MFPFVFDLLGFSLLLCVCSCLFVSVCLTWVLLNCRKLLIDFCCWGAAGTAVCWWVFFVFFSFMDRWVDGMGSRCVLLVEREGGGFGCLFWRFGRWRQRQSTFFFFDADLRFRSAIVYGARLGPVSCYLGGLHGNNDSSKVRVGAIELQRTNRVRDPSHTDTSKFGGVNACFNSTMNLSKELGRIVTTNCCYHGPRRNGRCCSTSKRFTAKTWPRSRCLRSTSPASRERRPQTASELSYNYLSAPRCPAGARQTTSRPSCRWAVSNTTALHIYIHCRPSHKARAPQGNEPEISGKVFHTSDWSCTDYVPVQVIYKSFTSTDHL